MSLLGTACALFSLGLYGVLSRRDLVGILASIEVMLGGALVLLVGLAADAGVSDRLVAVEGIALLVLVIAASEAAVGFALLVALANRSGRTRIDEVTEVRG